MVFGEDIREPLNFSGGWREKGEVHARFHESFRLTNGNLQIAVESERGPGGDMNARVIGRGQFELPDFQYSRITGPSDKFFPLQHGVLRTHDRCQRSFPKPYPQAARGGCGQVRLINHQQRARNEVEYRTFRPRNRGGKRLPSRESFPGIR